MSVRARLQAATSNAHDGIEATPFYDALRAGTLPAAAAESYLHCLAIIHAVLERGLSTARDPRVGRVWRDDLAKLPHLIEDLALRPEGHLTAIDPAVRAALAMADQLVQSPEIELLGYLYVFEGSQNGGIALKSLFAKSLDVAPDALRYFGCYGKETRRAWTRFVTDLDAIRLTDPEGGRIEAAAVAAFAGLQTIVLALFPFTAANVTVQLTALNPEAGRHALPDDPAEIAIAIRAGVRARERYPYLERRFGERGRRFTASDSCWLLTLMPLQYESIARSIAWLRTVLASRGIPTLILETHMRELATEIESAAPARTRETASFRRVVGELGASRRAHLPDAAVEDLNARFDQRLSALHGAVPLLASAHADEAAGVPGAYAAIESWLTDETRFGNEWRAAVRELSVALDAAASVS